MRRSGKNSKKLGYGVESKNIRLKVGIGGENNLPKSYKNKI